MDVFNLNPDCSCQENYISTCVHFCLNCSVLYWKRLCSDFLLSPPSDLQVNICDGRPVFPLTQATVWLQLIISDLPALPHAPPAPFIWRRFLSLFRHVVHMSLLVSCPCVLGSGRRRAHDGPPSRHVGPGAVLGLRPVRLLRGASCCGDGVFLALCSPWREILPELHGKKEHTEASTRFCRHEHVFMFTLIFKPPKNVVLISSISLLQ